MTLFGYTRDIPDGPHNPSADQPNMKINTNSTDDLINVDHFSFGMANGGLHRQVTIEQQGAYPSIPPTAAPTFGTLYTQRTLGTFAATELFYVKEAGPTGIQMTGPGAPTQILNANGAGSVTQTSFLPGGLAVITGFALDTVNGGTINLPAGIFTGFYTVQLCALGNSDNGTNRALVAQPRSANPLAGTIVVNLQDVNNNAQTTARPVYFFIIAV